MDANLMMALNNLSGRKATLILTDNHNLTGIIGYYGGATVEVTLEERRPLHDEQLRPMVTDFIKKNGILGVLTALADEEKAKQFTVVRTRLITVICDHIIGWELVKDEEEKLKVGNLKVSEYQRVPPQGFHMRQGQFYHVLFDAPTGDGIRVGGTAAQNIPPGTEIAYHTATAMFYDATKVDQ